jgi:hypothetical protein
VSESCNLKLTNTFIEYVQLLLIRNSVVCLSKGSGRLLTSDRSAPHNGHRLLRYHKACDNARVGIYSKTWL